MNEGETAATGRDVKGGGLTDPSYQGSGEGRRESQGMQPYLSHAAPGTHAHLCAHPVCLECMHALCWET